MNYEVKTSYKYKKYRITYNYTPSQQAINYLSTFERKLRSELVDIQETSWFKNKRLFYIDLIKIFSINNKNIRTQQMNSSLLYSFKSDISEIAYIDANIFNNPSSINQNIQWFLDDYRIMFSIAFDLRKYLYELISRIEIDLQYTLIALLEQKNIELQSLRSGDIRGKNSDIKFIRKEINKAITKRENVNGRETYVNIETDNNEIIKTLTFGAKRSLLKIINIPIYQKLFFFNMDLNYIRKKDSYQEIWDKTIRNMNNMSNIRNRISHHDFILIREILQQIRTTFTKCTNESVLCGKGTKTLDNYIDEIKEGFSNIINNNISELEKGKKENIWHFFKKNLL